jgi:hypothetical protein
LLGFRTLSLGLVAMEALAAIIGALLVFLMIVRRLPATTGFSLGLSLLFVLVGVVFVLIASAALESLRVATWKRKSLRLPVIGIG